MIVMDWFSLVPKDVLQDLFCFIESASDVIPLLRMCRNFFNVLRNNNIYWKKYSLVEWAKICNNHYDLEWIQKNSEKEW
jgi:hypothetical protein